MTAPDPHGGPVCVLCLEPVVAADQWEAFLIPTAGADNVIAHVTCLWALQEAAGQ